MSRKDNVVQAPRCEPLPPRPIAVTLQEFNEPRPSFSSNVQHITKRSFFFGLGDAHFTLRQPYTECFWVSQPEDVSDFESVKVTAHDFESDHSSIEYEVLIDNSHRRPVLPENKNVAFNELLRPGRPLRFAPDTVQPVQVYKNSEPVSISVAEAAELSDAVYTVTYTPADINSAKTVQINGDRIQVIVTMRLFDTQQREPYIENLFLKGYEGGITWRQIM